MTSKEPQVLEAVTAMARIATLAFHTERSKIAFRNHNIVICSPSTDSIYNLIPKRLIQGIDRYLNSDSRDDLHIFNHVIKNYIDLYVIPYENDPETYNNLINLAKYTCVGLMRLQKTYSDYHCNAVLVIQLYINTLRDLIRGNHAQSSIYSPIGYNEERITRNKGSDNDELTMSTIFDIEKFKTFWSKNELNRLCEQFEGCFKNKGELEEVIFSNNIPLTKKNVFGLINTSNNNKSSENKEDNTSIDDKNPQKNIQDSHESLFDSLMEQNSNNNSNMDKNSLYGDDFNLPEPNNQSLPIVKGLIVSIISILDAMDHRFSAVLTQSLQGVK
jgi:hypothetical protein